ncbi:unnamed protein product [Pipistrellus nathusii]|uniref:Uncharacterized protein n=1 Tax=Pipistrellus nathusii TaxID=59473 RepID=A0ABP0A6R9_PIPNA
MHMPPKQTHCTHTHTDSVIDANAHIDTDTHVQFHIHVCSLGGSSGSASTPICTSLEDTETHRSNHSSLDKYTGRGSQAHFCVLQISKHATCSSHGPTATSVLRKGRLIP